MKKEKCILGPEEVQAEKDYIVNVLGINLFDSEERDHRKHGYRFLALKYWPEIFENPDEIIEVHHINGDRSDNRVCNLVPVTKSQHRKLHVMYFQSVKESFNKFQQAGRQYQGAGENNGFYGKNHTTTSKNNIGNHFKGKSRYKDEFGKWHWEL